MRQLTISEWHSMAREGTAIPVRILIKERFGCRLLLPFPVTLQKRM